jgi:TPR repeat protein
VYQSQTVVSPKKVITQPVVAPKVEVKQESLFDIAKKSCLDGNAQGCIEFGYIMFNQDTYEGAKTAFSEAFRLGDKDGGMRGKYMVECMEKNAESCYLLGYVASKGKGGIQDYKLARVAYQKAIDLGYKYSLGGLAHLYANGLGGERNYFKATKLFEASCNAGTTDVNYEDCYNTGRKYDRGEGVRQDKFKAVKLYRKACNGKVEVACNDLGYMYSYGKGIRQNKATAQIYYGKACDMGNDLGCENYAKNNR